MATVYKTLELKMNPGHYRVCGTSDEDPGVFDDLCKCPGGHPSKLEAKTCPTASAQMDAIFPGRKKEPQASKAELLEMLCRHSPPGVAVKDVLAAPVNISILLGVLERCGVLASS